MSDVLAEALAAEGMGEPVADRVRQYLADRGFYITESWVQVAQRSKDQEQARRETAQAAAFAKAIPYAGTIKDCQTSVYEGGRGGTFRPCLKRARFVVRRKEVTHSRDTKTNDGRLAVCRGHASDNQSHRHHGHWSYERCATEPVEPEYQPEGEQP